MTYKSLACAWIAAAAGLLCPADGRADSEDAGTRKTGRYEIKRQNTARGTPDETSATTLRLERYFEGPVAMFRLDLPFPDEKTDFAGSPFQPRPGDMKMRLRFKAYKPEELSYTPFVEATFPTADPKSLGKGKYQLSAGVRTALPLPDLFRDAASHKSAFEFEIQQVNSVAGDPDTADVNYTKFEFTLFDVWESKHTLKLKLKPTVDWTRDGRTGGVVEAEYGRYFAQDWRWWLMIGGRAWGPGNIANTYKTRVELGLNYTY